MRGIPSTDRPTHIPTSSPACARRAGFCGRMATEVASKWPQLAVVVGQCQQHRGQLPTTGRLPAQVSHRSPIDPLPLGRDVPSGNAAFYQQQVLASISTGAGI